MYKYLLNIYLNKYPLYLYFIIILFAELITIVLHVSSGYLFYDNIWDEIVLKRSMVNAAIASIIITAFILPLIQNSEQMKKEIDELKINLDYMKKEKLLLSKILSYDVFDKKIKSEFNRAMRHNFTMVLFCIKINNHDQLIETYGEDNFNYIISELEQLLLKNKRSYDHLTIDEDNMFICCFNQVIPGNINSICKRTILRIRDTSINIKISKTMLTSILLNLDVSIKGIELNPNRRDTLDDILITINNMEDMGDKFTIMTRE